MFNKVFRAGIYSSTLHAKINTRPGVVSKIATISRGRRFVSLLTARASGNIVKLIIFMAVSKDLLEILVCPVCKAQVVLKEDGSGLKCINCKRVYPVRDDIPIMLVDQATIEP